MCRVYNQIGCLTAIKAHLHEHSINDYGSLQDLIDFQKNYSFLRHRIINKHDALIEQEKMMLTDKIPQLDYAIKIKTSDAEEQLLLKLQKLKDKLDKVPSDQPNVFWIIINLFKKLSLKLWMWVTRLIFKIKVAYSLRHLTKDYNQSNKRFHYIISNFERAVMESGLQELREIDRKRRVVGEINATLYGALGEQKVVKELEKLPDDWILINDFKCRFKPPIYNRRGNDKIHSVQIDHILISPSGVFLIETKNWNQQSLENLNLYSPVKQINRSNYALYKLLKDGISRRNISLNKHHWGDRKVPIKNLIVLIDVKPIEEFQHVKILTLNSLLRHVRWFEPCFSKDETESIANYLFKIAG